MQLDSFLTFENFEAKRDLLKNPGIRKNAEKSQACSFQGLYAYIIPVDQVSGQQKISHAAL